MNMDMVRIGGKRRVRQGVLTQAAYARYVTIWRIAARDMLEEIYQTMLLRHLDTGMSIGSLVPFGRILKVAGLQSYLHVKIGKRYYGTSIYGDYPPPTRGRHFKSTGLGIKMGERAERRKDYLISFGTQYRPVFRLKLKIQVLQWALHELGVGSFSSSLGALEAGINRFKESHTERLRSLPVELQNILVAEM